MKAHLGLAHRENLLTPSPYVEQLEVESTDFALTSQLLCGAVGRKTALLRDANAWESPYPRFSLSTLRWILYERGSQRRSQELLATDLLDTAKHLDSHQGDPYGVSFESESAPTIYEGLMSGIGALAKTEIELACAPQCGPIAPSEDSRTDHLMTHITFIRPAE